MAFKFNPFTGTFDLVSNPGGSSGYVQFNSSGIFGGDSNFYWDNTNKRLQLKGTSTPTYDFQMGDLITDLSATGSASGVFNYDGTGSYFNDGDQHAIRVYAYKLILGVPYYSSTYRQSATITDNNAGTTNYHITWTWSAVSGADGYVVMKSETDNFLDFEQGIDLGNVTSWDDNDGSAFGPISITPKLPVLPFGINGALMGIGTAPSSGAAFRIVTDQSNGIDITAPASGNGGNQLGAILVRNINDGIPRIRMYEASNGNTYGTFEVGSATQNGTVIIGEMDFINAERTSSGDKRMAGFQVLTGATKNSGMIVFYTSKVSGSSILAMISDAETNTTGVGWSGGGYTLPGSTLGIYGSLSVGTGYYSTAAPSNGAIIQGKVGIGNSGPTAVLHLGAGTASANTAPLKFTSGTNLTTKEAGAVEYNGNFYLTNANLRFPAGGTLFDHFADANNGTTVETDLYSDTLAASTFANNGDKVVAEYAGTFAGSGTSTQRLRAYFGGTLIFDSGALSIGVATDSWDLYVTCIRESSSNVRCVASLTTNFATFSAYATYTKVTGLTLTNTQILKITGQAAGVGGGSNQITASMSTVLFMPAA